MFWIHWKSVSSKILLDIKEGYTLHSDRYWQVKVTISSTPEKNNQKMFLHTHSITSPSFLHVSAFAVTSSCIWLIQLLLKQPKQTLFPWLIVKYSIYLYFQKCHKSMHWLELLIQLWKGGGQQREGTEISLQVQN